MSNFMLLTNVTSLGKKSKTSKKRDIKWICKFKYSK